jgi:hypothetical protein
MLTGQAGGQITFEHVAYMWENGMVPRGPVLGCHMAPFHWLFGKYFMGSTGVEPVTSSPGGAFWQGRSTSPPTVELNM